MTGNKGQRDSEIYSDLVHSNQMDSNDSCG